MILAYTQNRKLGNLGNMSPTSNSDSSYYSRFKNNKNMNWAKNWKVPMWFLKEKIKIPEIFQVFDFTLYRRSKTRKSRKFRLLWNFNSRFKNAKKKKRKKKKWTETKTKRFRYNLEQKRKSPRLPSFRFCSIPKIENSEISEISLLLQNLDCHSRFKMKMNWDKI